MKYRLIKAEKAHVPVARACRFLRVSQSGYFAFFSRGPSKRQRDDMVLLAHVREAFRLSHGTYGSPRMRMELKEQGLCAGRRRIARLMRENGLKGRQPRRWRCTTDSHHSFAVAPNLLERDFTASAPNEKWVADISSIWTQEGWLYLAVVIDLYARRVVGWSTGDRLHRDLAIRALNMALIRRQPSPGLIHHSDRGSQYASWEYQKTLKAHGALISMSGKGNCYDNAAMESFFKTIKSELVWRTRFLSRRQANDMIGKYIEGFYNPQRRHSTLGYLRVRLETHGWVFLRSKFPPMATRIMASETSRRAS